MEESEMRTVIDNCTACSDRLAAGGRVVDAGVVLMAVQGLKALWTKLHPPQAAETPATTTTVE